MILSLLPRVVWAVAALLTTGNRPLAPRAELHPSRGDSAAVAMISEELRAFYRDLHDKNWTSIITHFYPAKVTARFAVPDTDPTWAAAAAPAAEPHETPDSRGYCVPRSTIAIVGNWARVRTRRCTGELDEAWFYVMSGRWKMIHLVSGARSTSYFSPGTVTR
jgi:hypothetical protein